MYKLVIQDDEGKTTVVPLIRDELTIGRKEGNTIRLTERNVSRAHARLTRANGTVVIEDLNSYNGIRVNGSRIQGRATIAETDRVQIGDYLIEIRSAAEAAASDQTQPLDRTKATQEQETTRLPIGEESPVPSPMAAAAIPASVPPDVAALADTDPGRTASSVSSHGRLVVLSTNFPGQEFVLDKASMVIGRTDENDIWLNHRSISRHHAKIVLENNRYSIEDLQSSNGVRVNGEEYGKVELRRADVIDLGHVRLRFVEPGEDFVFGRDAQPVEVFPEGGSKTWLYAGIAGALLIGAIAAIMVITGGSDSNKAGAGSGTDDGSQIAVVAKDAAAVELPMDAAVAVKQVEPDAGDVAVVDAEKLKAVLADANKAMRSKKWSQALTAAEEAVALDPTNEEAKKIARDARDALKADDMFKSLQQISATSQYEEIDRLTADLAKTPYKQRATAIWKRAEQREYKALSGKLRNLARNKDCDEHKRVLRRAKLAKSKLRAIKCVPKEEPQPGDGDGDGDKPEFDLKAKTAEMKSASLAGQVKKAYSLCDEILKHSSSSAEYCTLVACRNKNTTKAKKYYRRMRSAAKKSQMEQLCMGQQVILK